MSQIEFLVHARANTGVVADQFRSGCLGYDFGTNKSTCFIKISEIL